MYAEIFDSRFEQHLHAPEANFFFALWQFARGIRVMPEEADLPCIRLEYLRSDLSILRPTGDGDWLHEHYGGNVAALSGFDMTGRKASEIPDGSQGFHLGIYERLRRERQPLVTLHRVGGFCEGPLWERLVLPVAQNGVISGVYVLNKVRETETDFSHLLSRARNRGMFVLQFRRDSRQRIVGATIIAASRTAMSVTGQRSDRMTGGLLLSHVPNISDPAFLDLCATVAADHAEKIWLVGQEGAEKEGRPPCRITVAPYLDGVTVEFEFGAEEPAGAVTSSLTPAA